MQGEKEQKQSARKGNHNFKCRLYQKN